MTIVNSAKMKNLVKFVWHLLTSVGTREKINRVRHALSKSYLIINPSYADDGLITEHYCPFMYDERFLRAYDRGRASGALDMHPGDIHYRAYVACWSANQVKQLDGDFVECGVGFGLLSSTICDYVEFNKLDKKFYLFDTFKGIPLEDASNRFDYDMMQQFNNSHYRNNYLERVRKQFASFKNVEIYPGKLPESVFDSPVEKISFLSIDLNNAVAEKATIEILWPKIVSRGIVLIDDYAYSEQFRSQREIWDVFAKIHGIFILTLPTGQGLVIKN